MITIRNTQDAKGKWRRNFAAAMLLVASLASIGSAEEEPIGRVNWVEGYISGFGIGLAEAGTSQAITKASSIRAAKVDALRNLLKTIHRLRIDPEVRVERHIASDNVIGERVSGLVKGARMVDQKIQWLNGSPLAVVEMRICTSSLGKECGNGASLISALDLEAFRNHRKTTNRKQLTSSPATTTADPKGGGPATGVVFSLGGLAYSRTLLPVIAASAADEIETVYSVDQVAPAVLRVRGAVQYADALDQVADLGHLGSNYLVVPVERIDGEGRLIISSFSARQISDSVAEGGNYLREARVVISTE